MSNAYVDFSCLTKLAVSRDCIVFFAVSAYFTINQLSMIYQLKWIAMLLLIVSRWEYPSDNFYFYFAGQYIKLYNIVCLITTAIAGRISTIIIANTCTPISVSSL